MFAQLISHSSLRQLKQQETLYTVNEKTNHFYYIVQGQFQLYVLECGQQKFSKTVDNKTYFGFKEDATQKRRDQAVAASAPNEVLCFDILKYQ